MDNIQWLQDSAFPGYYVIFLLQNIPGVAKKYGVAN